MSPPRAPVEMTTPQAMFVSYTLFVLVDLTVLNVFDEYWELVTIESFTISLAAAFLLQVLLKLTIALEHKVADYFKGKEGTAPKVYRIVTSYGILVASKFVMLGAINAVLGARVHFGGAFHGVVAFVVVIIAILLAEGIMTKIYRMLGGRIEA